MSMTKIAGRDIPIREDGDLITVHFSAGRAGGEEAGDYAFWAMDWPAADGVFSYTVRWPQGGDPGERFRIMEGAKGYERPWLIASNAQYIRRATEDEVIRWLNTHKSDAQFAESCSIGMETRRVMATVDGFRFL
jgi:hypothetical protein